MSDPFKDGMERAELIILRLRDQEDSNRNPEGWYALDYAAKAIRVEVASLPESQACWCRW
jgi:hypothetical protein